MILTNTIHFSFCYRHNLVAFYDSADPLGTNYWRKYANKDIDLIVTCQGKVYQFTALIADTCLGTICTITANQQTGYLVDIEFHTAMRIFGNIDCVVGDITFTIDLNQSPVLPNCGIEVGACGGQQCCSASNYCGYSAAYCGIGCQYLYGPCF